MAAAGCGWAAARPRLCVAGQRGKLLDAQLMQGRVRDAGAERLAKCRPSGAASCCAACCKLQSPATLLVLQIRTAYVTADSKGRVEVTAGLKDLKASSPARMVLCIFGGWAAPQRMRGT